MTALPPRAPAIPQKNALRDNVHLYESLGIAERWMQQAAAWMVVIVASVAELAATVAALPGELTLYESTTAADGAVKTFAFDPALASLSVAFIDGAAVRPKDVTVVAGAVVLGVDVAAPDTGSIVTAQGTT